MSGGWPIARIAFIIVCLGLTVSMRASVVDDAFFETRIRPVLVERCFSCHSRQATKLKANLHLDSRAGLLRGGDSGVAVVAGEPLKSRLIEAIRYENFELQMPPKGRLTDAQIDDFTEWVKAGAPWPKSPDDGKDDAPAAGGFNLAERKAKHWAWRAVQAAAIPTVRDAAWPADPIDSFILSKLEAAGLRPAPPADARTLIRRVTFDLTGLPPTPAEVEAFAADPSPAAYAQAVDRLLASPRFGEHWGRHWLDLVRYAETRGHEFDYAIPNGWRYRDYVIRALNADVPYDQFVKEHIAGDLLPNPRRDEAKDVNESVIGTGFWHFGEWLHSPVDIRQDEADRVDNQIDVMGKAFLGLTIGCARCHDHKFDAISQRDYYGLVGFLNSSGYRDAAFQFQKHNADISAKLNENDAAMRVELSRTAKAAFAPGLDRTVDYLMAAAEQLNGRPAGCDNLDSATLAAWTATLTEAIDKPLDPLHAFAMAARSAGGATTLPPPSVLRGRVAEGAAAEQRATDRTASNPSAPSQPSPGVPREGDKGTPPAGSTVVVDYGAMQSSDWITDGFAFGDGPKPAGDWVVQGDSIRLRPEGAAVAVPGRQLPGLLRTPTFIITGPSLWIRVAGEGDALIVIDSHRMIQGPLHGVCKQPIKTGDELAWIQADLRPYVGQRAHVELRAAEARSLAVASVWQGAAQPVVSTDLVAADLSTSLEENAKRLQSCFKQTGDFTPSAESASFASWMLSHPDCFGAPAGELQQSLRSIVKRHEVDRSRLLTQFKLSPTAMAMLDGNGVDEHVLLRGNPKTPGEVVPRRFIEALKDLDAAPRAAGSGRLQLAEAIANPANPLTARVMVNRIWHHLFGRGIVASTDNFGVLGDAPSHPELLDHLASRFVSERWSVKRLIREIVLSSTYRMSSRLDADAERLDPQNKLLHRANVRRLPAEAIRDSILAVAGRLDDTHYGPSVKVHLTPFMEGRGRPTEGGPLDGAGRRSVYIEVRRNFLSPMMLAFDAPAPFNAMGRRTVSNVPAQALILLNDPFVAEESRRWAEKAIRENADPAARVRAMYEAAFAHGPSDEQLAESLEFVRSQGEALGVPPDQCDADPRSWADFAHVLMNVKEFIFLN